MLAGLQAAMQKLQQQNSSPGIRPPMGGGMGQPTRPMPIARPMPPMQMGRPQPMPLPRMGGMGGMKPFPDQEAPEVGGAPPPMPMGRPQPMPQGQLVVPSRCHFLEWVEWVERVD